MNRLGRIGNARIFSQLNTHNSVTMRSVEVILYLVIMSLSSCKITSLKVLNFEETLTNKKDAEMTNATVMLGADLAQQFVLCASYKWGKVAAEGMFQVQGM